ncbi:zinc finger, MYND domain containing 12 [Trypanosoma rangeli]|uniref:Zinc finger, MYND domain containing 12 n=1 Tax=Trypanosoma rangeli TaxID=5698 RepID=A0A3R7KSW5_TRYRA|nr:zinc finger, MYND domain containing 12 [Trypanosoma rangeli]RNF09030.1 zinc finger, MYND domain containing 12 [Trypanosoma rangeli]|eukprot:RNF09030.1 zinc finger, MYND domain containing 12 [Trypanosoma rangeli]
MKNKAGSIVKGCSSASQGAVGVESDPFDVSGAGWASLESRFDELICLMDAPSNGINALAARSAHGDRVANVISQLLDQAQDESRRLLVEGNGEAAVEAGVKTLRLKERFYGKKSVKLVPAYFHLARTNQFLGRYGNAEEMLSLAHFIILNHPEEVGTATKAELHQTFGLLYAADNKIEAAIQHLTAATYYLSVLNGPVDVLTSFGYFDLANVFVTKASMEGAMALYDTVKNIWFKYLRRVLQDIVEEALAAKAVKRYEDDEVVQDTGYASAKAFGKENLADVSKMLHAIYKIQRERFTTLHPTTARAQFVLGLFLLWVSEKKKAGRHLRTARVTTQHFHGERHPVVQEIEEWCEWFEIPLENDDAEERKLQ